MGSGQGRLARRLLTTLGVAALWGTVSACRSPQIGLYPEPIVLVDEGRLSGVAHYTAPFPQTAWDGAFRCAEAEGVFLAPDVRAMNRPPLIVVRGARAFIVHDLARDSIIATLTGQNNVQLSPPVEGYAFVRSHAIAIREQDKANPVMLRHEAYHIVLWHAAQAFGHPAGVFERCDAAPVG